MAQILLVTIQAHPVFSRFDATEYHFYSGSRVKCHKKKKDCSWVNSIIFGKPPEELGWAYKGLHGRGINTGF
jgi:hypothetical protein